MSGLPRNQYSATFSLDSASSPLTPQYGRRLAAAAPAAFKATPLKMFTVVVSIVPADQLQPGSLLHARHPASAGASAAAGATVATALDAFGGVSSFASSIPLSTSAAGGFRNSSFALTKSFDDVFTLKRPAGNSGGGGGSLLLGASGPTNSSLEGDDTPHSAAMAAAAAALHGHADPSVPVVPVLQSRDAYRVHLLLPSDAAAPPHRRVAAPPKRKQAAQVKERWVLFQQLMCFVLSVAPRFEPPPPPPGFAFPVDLGMSFVQTSSIFSATEAHQGSGRSGGAGTAVASPAGAAMAASTAAAETSPDGSPEDPLVRGEEREARRAYMESYLNLALQCDQVNCLKEVQAFVGYHTYLKDELARFRVMSRTPSSSSSLDFGGAAAGMTRLKSSNALDGGNVRPTPPESSAPRGPRSSSAHSNNSHSPARWRQPDSPPASVASEAVMQPRSAGALSASPPTLARSLPPSLVLPLSAPDTLSAAGMAEGERRPTTTASLPDPAVCTAPSSVSSDRLLKPRELTSAEMSVPTNKPAAASVGSADSDGRAVSASALFPKPLSVSVSSGGSHGGRPSAALPAPSVRPPSLAGSLGARPDAADAKRGGSGPLPPLAASMNSSHSAASSFGSSVSHTGSPRRHRSHRRPDATTTDSHSREDEEHSTPAAPVAGSPTQPHGRQRVAVAPESERMLVECFRLMDGAGRDYVTAGDCSLFFLCATPETFQAALHLDRRDDADGDVTSGDTITAQGAAAEALMPPWMRECAGVVTGHPDYLISCPRFVDAVHEVLETSAAMRRPTAVRHTSQRRANGGSSDGRRSHQATPGSSVWSPTSSPVLLTSSPFTRRPAGSPPLLLDAVLTELPIRRHGASSSVGEEAGTAGETNGDLSSSPAEPVPSLEAWIDNFWLLLYARLFSAVAAAAVGEEAAALRTAVLAARERAYLETTARFTAAAASATPHTADTAIAAPPWLLHDVARAVAAQQPLLGRFDALEVLCLVYVVRESGLRVTSLEDVLGWLGTTDFAHHVRFSLDEFASLLDALSCAVPFADVLRCVRHRGGPSADATDMAATWNGLVRDRTHLLRLIARGAAAGPAEGREFNDLVQEQRRRRGGDECLRCPAMRGVLQQQAGLLANLMGENAQLQRRVAELEEQARVAVVVCDAAASLPLVRREGNVNEVGAAPDTPAHGAAAPVASVSAPVSSASRALGQDAQLESAPPLPDRATQLAAPSKVSTALASVDAVAVEIAAQVPHRMALELLPLSTPYDETAARRHAYDGEARALRHASAAARAAAAHVTRPGPLLYLVPPRQRSKQPTELCFSFYLCRADRGGRATPTTASAAAPTAAVMEVLTVRDGAGHRVLAFKMSPGTLSIFGGDTAPPAPPHPSRVIGAVAAAPRLPSVRCVPGMTECHSLGGGVGVRMRPRNILYPSYDGGDLDRPWGDDGGTAAARHAGSGDAVARPSPSPSPAVAQDDRRDATKLRRGVSRVEVAAHTWYAVALGLDWQQRTVHLRVEETQSSGATDAATLFTGTVRMLESEAASGIASVDVAPRREMLVAYCNVVVRYETAL